MSLATAAPPHFPLRRLAQVSLLVATANVVATAGALVALPYASAAGQRLLIAAGTVLSGALFMFGTMLSLRKAWARRAGFVTVAVTTLAAALVGLLALVVPTAAVPFIAWALALLVYVAYATPRLVRWEGHPLDLPTITLPVFISYRRDDSRDTVGRLHDHLRQRLEDERLFLDVDDQMAGEDYRVAIRRALEQAAVVLVIIGPRWLAVTDASGQRRIDDPHDMVRFEVETALQRGTRVIPVLVEGASMPAAATLPPSLQPLSYRNAMAIRPDPDFVPDMQRLIDSLAGPPVTQPAN